MKIRETDYDDDDFEFQESMEKFKPKKNRLPSPDRLNDRKKRVRRLRESDKEE